MFTLVFNTENDYSEFALEWLVEELIEDGDEIVSLHSAWPFTFTERLQNITASRASKSKDSTHRFSGEVLIERYLGLPSCCRQGQQDRQQP